MRIETYTGRETHSTYGAQGQVFVVTPPTETPIYQAAAARKIDGAWFPVAQGKHGNWVATTYDVPAGALLKLFAIRTAHGKRENGGGAYFVVDAAAPRVKAQGAGYGDNVGALTGNLRRLSLAEAVALGVIVDAKYRAYYQPGCVTVAPAAGGEDGDAETRA